MHTAAFRANALLTFAGTALAVLAALASVTGAPQTRLGEGVCALATDALRRRLVAQGGTCA